MIGVQSHHTDAILMSHQSPDTMASYALICSYSIKTNNFKVMRMGKTLILTHHQRISSATEFRVKPQNPGLTWTI